MSVAKRLAEEAQSSRAFDFRRSYGTAYGRVNFNMFFDRTNVTTRLDRWEQRVLGGTGAFGRKVIRQGIRKGRQTEPRGSAPGQSPRYHHRGFASLKDGIFFEASVDYGNVLMGPSKVITRTIPGSGLESGAQLLEEGGMAVTYMYKHRSAPGAGVYMWIPMYMEPRPYVARHRDRIADEMLKIMHEKDM